MVVVGVMGAGVTGPSEREYGAHQPRSRRLACECPPLAPRLCPGGGGALRTAHALGSRPVPSFRPPPPLPFRLSSVPVTQHSPALRLPPETARGDAKRDGLALDADLDLGGSAFFEPTACHCVGLPDIHAGFRTLQHRSACSHGKD